MVSLETNAPYGGVSLESSAPHGVPSLESSAPQSGESRIKRNLEVILDTSAPQWDGESRNNRTF